MTATHEPRMARAAALIADPTRSRMLAYLMGGAWASAGELAKAAGVTPATTSAHLARLLDAEFVVCQARGRHRYYRLADEQVAHALEALAMVAERGTHEREWQRPARARLREARCCYGHLAGRLGVRLHDALCRDRRLVRIDARSGDDSIPAGADDAAYVDGYALTTAGQAWLRGLGFSGPLQPASRRRFAYPCLDWSERRDHLGGQLADALLDHCIDRDWLRRGAGRDLVLTPRGRLELEPRLAA